MKFGVVFPQTEVGNDPGVIREFAQAADDLGYEHLLAFEHVLGADPVKHPDLPGLYTIESPFHEPFVLYGYLAGVTSRIKLTTGIVVLPAAADGPRRQAGGGSRRAERRPAAPGRRPRLEPRRVRGAGAGHPHPRPPGGGADRPAAGVVDGGVRRLHRAMAHGERRGHQPAARPAAHPHLDGRRRREPVLRRVGALADGWLPMMQPDEAGRAALERVHGYVLARPAATRPPSRSVRARTSGGRRRGEYEWASVIAAWAETGATQLDAMTMFGGYDTPQHSHIDAISVGGSKRLRTRWGSPSDHPTAATRRR